MSQRDVPGMTRSVIPLLLQQGVLAISEGVNSYSAPPVVPTIFNWSDAAGGSLIYMVRLLMPCSCVTPLAARDGVTDCLGAGVATPVWVWPRQQGRGTCITTTGQDVYG